MRTMGSLEDMWESNQHHGKFNVDQIIRADNVYTDKADIREIVQLWPELKDQMSYLL